MHGRGGKTTGKDDRSYKNDAKQTFTHGRLYFSRFNMGPDEAPQQTRLDHGRPHFIIKSKTDGFRMNPRKQRRLAFVAALILASGIGALLIVSALRDNVLYFYSPSDVVKKHVQPGIPFRIGGLVRKQSLEHGEGAEVTFVVTDGRDETVVQYEGILPALFREGQGVVAMGQLTPAGVFVASQILAKHDERYMPPEVVNALKRSGRWKEGGS